jgi:DNA-binding MarR family transcriptional regulator
MARPRVSRLQKHILRLLMEEHHRTHGGTSMGHLEPVKVLAGDKSTISHSLHTVETRGWIIIGRTPGGRAEYLDLTPEGLEKASEIYIQL